MLVNKDTYKVVDNHVKFISYTGKYPNLCRGVLTLEIDGIEFKFGHNSSKYDFKSNTFKDEDPNDPNYSSFWSSGGGINPNYEGSYSGEWNIDISELPEQFQKYAAEIDEVFNDNVPYGCCGGCI